MVTRLAVVLIWAGAVGLLLVRSPHGGRRVYQAMAAAQVVLLAELAWWERNLVGAGVVALEAVLKVGVVPWLLSHGAPLAEEQYGARGIWGASGLVWGALGFTGLGLASGYRLGVPASGLTGAVLAAGLILLWGLAMRRDPWVQAVQLLALDTVLGALAFLALQGLPPVADGLALADLVGMAAILAALERTNRIRFGVVDTTQLKELKG
ncbi:conserved membrane protein of unknown function [Candidatus Hydrogenisulfobacillus filiaventi]|uniref:Hydrogenase-4 component E n=1 Tax=Candidatus Hydrogenisulfobacillus filiaventi TaxID=2707344 RepID=A0A6F8ZCY1_9FIRM|nr:conserved membrane protein of unknown function [Candidatus Hydrogenisulfobacillus filiaventi]